MADDERSQKKKTSSSSRSSTSLSWATWAEKYSVPPGDGGSRIEDDVMRIYRSDIGLYGLSAKHEELCLAICSQCKKSFKIQALHGHYERRHAQCLSRILHQTSSLKQEYFGHSTSNGSVESSEKSEKMQFAPKMSSSKTGSVTAETVKPEGNHVKSYVTSQTVAIRKSILDSKSVYDLELEEDLKRPKHSHSRKRERHRSDSSGDWPQQVNSGPVNGIKLHTSTPVSHVPSGKAWPIEKPRNSIIDKPRNSLNSTNDKVASSQVSKSGLSQSSKTISRNLPGMEVRLEKISCTSSVNAKSNSGATKDALVNKSSGSIATANVSSNSSLSISSQSKDSWKYSSTKSATSSTLKSSESKVRHANTSHMSSVGLPIETKTCSSKSDKLPKSSSRVSEHSDTYKSSRRRDSNSSVDTVKSSKFSDLSCESKFDQLMAAENSKAAYSKPNSIAPSSNAGISTSAKMSSDRCAESVIKPSRLEPASNTLSSESALNRKKLDRESSIDNKHKSKVPKTEKSSKVAKSMSQCSRDSRTTSVDIPSRDKHQSRCSTPVTPVTPVTSNSSVSLLSPTPPIVAGDSSILSRLIKKPRSKEKPQKDPTSYSIQCKDRLFDPNRHCGVVVADTNRPCTHSLTCKIHSLSQRRLVCDRSKPFDLLLEEHRARKEASKREKLEARAKLTQPNVETTTTLTTPILSPTMTSSSSSSAPVHTLTTAVSTSCVTTSSVLTSDQLVTTSCHSTSPTCTEVEAPLPAPVIPIAPPRFRGPLTKSTYLFSPLMPAKLKEEIGMARPTKLPIFPRKDQIPLVGEPLPLSDEDEDTEIEDNVVNSSFSSNAHHPRPIAVNRFGSWRHSNLCHVFNRKEDVYRSAFNSALERHLHPPPNKKLCVVSSLPTEPSANATLARSSDPYDFHAIETNRATSLAAMPSIFSSPLLASAKKEKVATKSKLKSPLSAKTPTTKVSIGWTELGSKNFQSFEFTSSDPHTKEPVKTGTFKTGSFWPVVTSSTGRVSAPEYPVTQRTDSFNINSWNNSEYPPQPFPPNGRHSLFGSMNRKRPSSDAENVNGLEPISPPAIMSNCGRPVPYNTCSSISRESVITQSGSFPQHSFKDSFSQNGLSQTSHPPHQLFTSPAHNKHHIVNIIGNDRHQLWRNSPSTPATGLKPVGMNVPVGVTGI